MSRPDKQNYFWTYSEKWERALKEKRYHDALGLAIHAYLASRDLQERSFETASLAYMHNAIQNLNGELRDEKIKYDKKHQNCSFCGRDQSEVRLMAGADANICAECVSKVRRFFETESKGRKLKSKPKPRKPKTRHR